MVHRPVLKSNLHPVFEVFHLYQCYLRVKGWTYTHPQLQSDGEINVCLFYMSLKALPTFLDAYHLFIM